MNIGEKIAYLRISKNLSQEELAEKLSVSRQSVSKWEIGQAFPQIEKILAICSLFSVSADDLLRDSVEFGATAAECGKYFGTDGFRGEANLSLTSNHAYEIGRFLGWYYSKNKSGSDRARIVIGKDTRRSSYMLEYSIVAGITASGADVYMLHVTTTPSVSYVTRQDSFDCGVMITASHNPFYDNGIKIINSFGEKLEDGVTALIEEHLDSGKSLPLAERDKIGRIVDYVAGRNRYVGYLISVAANSYKKLRIGLDCANGASWSIAKSVFDALGAKTYVTGAEPDGLNINSGCGSTHIENLITLVKQNRLDVGFAFDGDADRCIAVDQNGNVVDGDGILYILSQRLKERDMLENNCVVATVMSNSGLFASLSKKGIDCVQTAVGDRFVYERMLENSYSLGGEQSGHIIIKKYSTTGDGILTAIMVCEQMCDRKSTLSNLCEGFFAYPQLTVNLKVASKDAVLSDEKVNAALERVKEKSAARAERLFAKAEQSL